MTIRLDIEYDGALYSGWQIQPKADSVQAALEKALKICLRETLKVTGAGRTDAGVHARGQVAHFIPTTLSMTLYELKRSLNALLGEGITIHSVSEAPEGFHARYSAKSRHYVYSISKGKRSIDRNRFWHVPYPLDLNKMRQAAGKIMGKHDFKNLSTATDEKSTLCTVTEIEIDETEEEIILTISANRFLHKMVRMITGVLVEIGRGRLDTGYLKEAFGQEKLARKKGFCAPAHGLCLTRVTY